jgi:hypothetical protein
MKLIHKITFHVQTYLLVGGHLRFRVVLRFNEHSIYIRFVLAQKYHEIHRPSCQSWAKAGTILNAAQGGEKIHPSPQPIKSRSTFSK